MGSGQLLIRFVDWGSGIVDNIRILTIVDGASDVIGVDLVLDVVVMCWRDDIVDEIGLDVIFEGGFESGLHVARPIRISD